MCKCKVGWVRNPAISGAHNIRPVTCDEYVAALEQALIARESGSHGTDSASLDHIQRTFGISVNPLQDEMLL